LQHLLLEAISYALLYGHVVTLILG
jgi:hypothetical protein